MGKTLEVSDTQVLRSIQMTDFQYHLELQLPGSFESESTIESSNEFPKQRYTLVYQMFLIILIEHFVAKENQYNDILGEEHSR